MEKKVNSIFWKSTAVLTGVHTTQLFGMKWHLMSWGQDPCLLFQPSNTGTEPHDTIFTSSSENYAFTKCLYVSWSLDVISQLGCAWGKVNNIYRHITLILKGGFFWSLCVWESVTLWGWGWPTVDVIEKFWHWKREWGNEVISGGTYWVNHQNWAQLWFLSWVLDAKQICCCTGVI